ncbi:MAG: hypothetical protein BJ554DRAFT_4095, partial [Olpidium bornovanus]
HEHRVPGRRPDVRRGLFHDAARGILRHFSDVSVFVRGPSVARAGFAFKETRCLNAIPTQRVPIVQCFRATFVGWFSLTPIRYGHEQFEFLFFISRVVYACVVPRTLRIAAANEERGQMDNLLDSLRKGKEVDSHKNKRVRDIARREKAVRRSSITNRALDLLNKINDSDPDKPEGAPRSRKRGLKSSLAEIGDMESDGKSESSRIAEGAPAFDAAEVKEDPEPPERKENNESRSAENQA